MGALEIVEVRDEILEVNLSLIIMTGHSYVLDKPFYWMVYGIAFLTVDHGWVFRWLLFSPDFSSHQRLCVPLHEGFQRCFPQLGFA